MMASSPAMHHRSSFGFRLVSRRACGLLVCLLSIASAGGCSDGLMKIDGYDPEKGGDPLVVEMPALPYPSDFYLEADETTATGRRLVIPETVMPSTRIDVAPFDQDGFTIIPAILTYLPGGTDVDSLPSPTEHGESVADDSSVLLVREGTWERVGVLAELDQTTTDVERQTIIIRPLKSLDYETGYVVILRNSLRRPDGTPHEAVPAFRALRDGVKTNIPELEAKRENFELVREAIEGANVPMEEVVQAWSFHTRSEDSVSKALVEMQRVADTVEIPETDSYTIEKDDVEGTERVNRQIAGTLTAVPNFIHPETLKIEVDEDGMPVQFGTREVPFVLTVPSTVTEARPLIIYGHGFLGERIQATRGSYNNLCHLNQMSTAAVDFGFHEGLLAFITKIFTGEWDGLNQASASVLQTFVNSTYLARVAKERFPTEIVGGTEEEPHALFDGENTHYLGISNGGTFGYVMTATSAQIERSVLVVGGGGLVHFLQRAQPWLGYAPFLESFLPDPRAQQLAFSMLQQLLDPIDSMNYLHRMVHDRYPGLPEVRASVHMAINDSQVHNLVTEWAMRTANIPYVTPSPKTIWNLPEVHADDLDDPELLAVMHVYDEQVEPSPIVNIPPATDNGTHGTVRNLDSYYEQVGTFLRTGEFVHACDGPCDPN
jgi:hypothetical protein